MEYFRFVNIIFESLMAREAVRREVGETGLFQRWCQLAITFTLNNDLQANLKSDFIGFLKIAWKFFPDLFEEKNQLPEAFVGFLTETISSGPHLMSVISVSTLFDLLALFSQIRRKWAPEIFKRLNTAFIQLHRFEDLKNHFIKCYMDLFVSADIPAEILMDIYLPFV